MTVFILKIIAVISMLIDHIAYAFPDFVGNAYDFMRSLGRFAFPLYCFLIAEGYYHIKDKPEKVKQHFTRLIVLTFLSEVPFDLVLYRDYYNISGQSVMLTLLMGMFALMAIDKFKDNRLYGVFSLTVVIQVSGILMILFYYWYLSKHRDDSIKTKYLLLTVFSLTYLAVQNYFNYGKPAIKELLSRSLEDWNWMVPFFVINLVLVLYNGKNGYKNKILNSCYAYFYPVHLMIIALVLVLTGDFFA